MAERSQFRLLGERRFAPFFAVQFLGALNDNVFKQALVILLAYQTAAWTSMSSSTLQNLAQALFVLPFFLFSATAGQLADKYEKSRLIMLTVGLEVVCMILGAIGLLTGQLWMLLSALFLGGVQSSLFGPVKYAILPQVLREDELVGGNALVETGTSVAILGGMLIGGWMVARPGWGVPGVAVLTIALAVAGLALSRAIPRAAPPAPHLRVAWNPIVETWRNLRFLGRDRTVFHAVLGISWFWFFGALIAAQLPNLARVVLGGTEQVVTLLLLAFSVGVGAGSLLCERLSGHKVEIGLVPFGSIGLTVFAVDLWFATSGWIAPAHPLGPAAFARDTGLLRIAADLSLIGVFGGLYIVPLYAMVQSRSDASHRSRVIAGNNILNAAFMVAAALLAIVLLEAGLGIPQLFLVAAVLNAAVAAYIYGLVPEFLMRFMVWILVHSVYRLEKRGLDRIPERGAAILVCNHVSFVDALVISAACRRRIRWVMDHRIFRWPMLSFFFRTAGAIPIAPAREDPEMLARAYEAISRELADGRLVGIFPEGRLTTDGEVGEFRGGIARILARDPVPVVPMALSGLWRSVFARNREKLRHLGRLFPRIRLSIGEPIAPQEAEPRALRETVLALRGDWR